MDNLDVLTNIGGQTSDLSEKVGLELGAYKSCKVNETILKGQAKKKNPQEINEAVVDSAFVRPDELMGETIILTGQGQELLSSVRSESVKSHYSHLPLSQT